MPRMSMPSAVLIALLAISGSAAAAAPYIGVAPQGQTDAAKSVVRNTCSGCHGMHGHAVSPTFPNLAGQNYNYLLKQLEDFRSGAWHASPMSGMVKTVPRAKNDQNLKNLAAYFSAQTPDRTSGGGSKLDKSLLAHGHRIFEQGVRKENVPACAACHMQNGTGIAPMAVPRLAGQNAKYLAQQLDQFASGKRSNSPHRVMHLIAGRLGADEIHAVSAYLQDLRPPRMPGAGPSTYAALVRQAQRDPVPGIPPAAIRGNSRDGG